MTRKTGLKKKENRFRPKKSLGQHFLKDQHVIEQIIEKADFGQTDNVLEIGPGFGALTIPLARLVNRVVAVEKDSQVIEMLREKLNTSNISNVSLLNNDILKIDFDKIVECSEEKIRVIGNLPYNISSPLLEILIRHRSHIKTAVLMFQTEFANRLLSPPNSKDYGALTVLTRYNATILPLLEISANAFYPRPKVGSKVIRIDVETQYPRRSENETLFKTVVAGAFAYRRKTIQNSLKRALKPPHVDLITNALQRCAIDPGRRAETLDMDEFINLADEFERLNREVENL